MRTLLLALVAAVPVACSKQQPAAPTPQRPAGGQAGAPAADRPSAGGQDAAGARPSAAPPRPYARVITSEARTRSGLFKAHRVGERLYFEIPRNELNKDMLVVTRAATGGDVAGFLGGGSNRVVAWERSGNRILLRGRTFNISADTARAISRAVEAMRFGPIIASFNVESWGPDSAAVIEVTRLFTTNIPEFALVTGVVADRSFIEQVSAFPENVNVLVTQTGTQPIAPTFGVPAPQPPAGTTRPAFSQQMLWSMLKLPETPMRPRLHDRRIGLGSV
ncbi:MAG TPA: DUF5117 domain-containing protein, partial [Longimicrobiales bacterium]